MHNVLIHRNASRTRTLDNIYAREGRLCLRMKQVVHGDLAVEDAPRFGLSYAKGGEVGVNKGVGGLCGGLEDAGSFAQSVRLLRGEMVGARRELHFAEVYDVVGTGDDEVYLCALLSLHLVCRLSPGRSVCADGSNAERLLDLAEMDKRKQLESVALPIAYAWGRNVVTPPVLILGLIAGNETEVEQRVEVNESVDDILALVTEVLITMNEVASFKVAQHLRQYAALDVCQRHNLLACESFAMVCQRSNNVDVTAGFGKRGVVEFVELHAQGSTVCEIQAVDILNQAFTLIKQVEIVGYAAQGHIGLENLVVVPWDMAAVKKGLSLVESEGVKIDAGLNTPVETSLAVKEIIYHPRRGTAAGYEDDVITSCRPAVPEVLRS